MEELRSELLNVGLRLPFRALVGLAEPAELVGLPLCSASSAYIRDSTARTRSAKFAACRSAPRGVSELCSHRRRRAVSPNSLLHQAAEPPESGVRQAEGLSMGGGRGNGLLARPAHHFPIDAGVLQRGAEGFVRQLEVP